MNQYDSASRDRANIWRLRSVSLTQFCSLAIIFTFYGITMKRSGLGEFAIGLIFAGSTLLSGVMGLVWADLAGKQRSAGRLIALGSLLCAVAFALIPAAKTGFQFLAISCLMAIASSAFFTLLPVVAFNAMPSESAGRGYGRFRVFGSIGFLIGTFGFSSVAHSWSMNNAFYAAAVIMLIPSLIMFFDKGGVAREEKKSEQSQVTGLAPVYLLMAAVFVMTLGMPGNFTFLTIYADDLGAGQRHIGWLMGVNGLMGLIGLPLMGLVGDKIGPRLLILFAIIAQPLRSLGYSLVSENYQFLFLVQVLHIFTWAGLEIGVLMLLKQVAGSHMYQKLYSRYIFVRQIGMVAGNYLVGYLAENYGYIFMYQVIAIITTLAIPVYVKLYFQTARKVAAIRELALESGE